LGDSGPAKPEAVNPVFCHFFVIPTEGRLSAATRRAGVDNFREILKERGQTSSFVRVFAPGPPRPPLCMNRRLEMRPWRTSHVNRK